jgi:hypothetical protein
MRRRPRAVLIGAPAPNQDCPVVAGDHFGNTDIFGGSYLDPTTP